jgi:hypothetical protein
MAGFFRPRSHDLLQRYTGTNRIWGVIPRSQPALRYELFRGKLTEGELDASEANLGEYIKARSNMKPHLLAYWDAGPGRELYVTDFGGLASVQ